jgi:hypothetical protein
MMVLTFSTIDVEQDRVPGVLHPFSTPVRFECAATAARWASVQ